jgi:thiamine biosynthesis protein ThiI
MKGLVLNSGGIDSPVAAYLMGKHDLTAVHFDVYPYSETKPVAENVIEQVNKVLKKDIPVLTVPQGDILSQFLDVCGDEGKKYTCIFCKRMMFRTAEKIAHETGCSFLITGENLGQVASQTLQNMYVTSRAVTIPIVRPVIGLDKLDIIALAEKIGTFRISIEKAAVCGAVPKYPVTRARLDKIEALEQLLGIDAY